MDEKYQPKIEEWIIKNWKHGPCPVCTENQWQVAENFAYLTQYNPEKGLTISSFGGPFYPLLPIVCDSCGNTLLVNAIAAGFIDSEVDLSDKDESQ